MKISQLLKNSSDYKVEQLRIYYDENSGYCYVMEEQYHPYAMYAKFSHHFDGWYDFVEKIKITKIPSLTFEDRYHILFSWSPDILIPDLKERTAKDLTEFIWKELHLEDNRVKIINFIDSNHHHQVSNFIRKYDRIIERFLKD